MQTQGNRLRTARTKKGLTHEKAAALAGRKRAWYTKLENNEGNPLWVDMVKVGEGLETSLDYLAHGGLPRNPALWARYERLPPEHQAAIELLINTLYDRETLLRAVGDG